MDTAQAKMFVCSLNNSAAKIMIAFVLARAALDVQDLREWTGMKRETIYEGLKTLKARGMVVDQIAAHGRVIWVPSGNLLPGFQMSENRTSELQVSGIGTPALVAEVDSINLKQLKESTSTESQMSENRTSEEPPERIEYPSVQAILEATNLLFGSPGVVTSGLDLDTLKPWTVLGWIGYAWDHWREGGGHGNLFAPAGVIYNKLADPTQPHAPGGFHEGAWRILPVEFLQRLNLESVIKETEEAVIEAVPIKLTANGSVTPEIETVWQSVLQMLQLELPKAQFETWVQDTQVLRYDGNGMLIGTRNSYAQELLRGLLTEKVELMLLGMLNAPIKVSFVVAQLESEE